MYTFHQIIFSLARHSYGLAFYVLLCILDTTYVFLRSIDCKADINVTITGAVVAGVSANSELVDCSPSSVTLKYVHD